MAVADGDSPATRRSRQRANAIRNSIQQAIVIIFGLRSRESHFHEDVAGLLGRHRSDDGATFVAGEVGDVIPEPGHQAAAALGSASVGVGDDRVIVRFRPSVHGSIIATAGSSHNPPRTSVTPCRRIAAI